ncbi:MAG: ABC transporter substrate-binding protein, partial [bacterium]
YLVVSYKEPPGSDQQSISGKRIAVLQLGTHPVINEVVNGLNDRVKELYKDSVAIELYNANFDFSALSMLANQMVSSKPNVLVGVTTPAVGQLIGANRGSFPLVFTFVSDPRDIGYTGRGSKLNVTGLSDKVEYRKTLSLIRYVMPKARIIGYIVTKSENNAITIHKKFSDIAPNYGFQIKTVTIDGAQDVPQASELLVKSVDLFLFGGDNTVMSAINVVIATAKSRKLPVFSCDKESVQKGAVAAYSVPYREMGRRTADYCGLILSGAKPDCIPVEDFSGNKLVINLPACNELGLTMPEILLNNADLIIR